MYKSILQIFEKGIIKIEKKVGEILTGETDIDDLSAEIKNWALEIGRNLQVEIYEMLDEEIRDSICRKKNWNIERRNEPKEILDVMGMVRFKRTGYKDKRTGEYIYLLDQVLGIEGHQRITLGAAAEVLEETVMSSYSRGGKHASPTDAISKQAVKKLVHKTEVKIPLQKVETKKKVKYLHIVADEDHVAAQFWDKKGDLKTNENGQKINTIQAKLICVYEDVINEAGEKSKSPRYKLIGKRYFNGVCTGRSANERLWEEVAEYIEATYDTDVLERIYIAGDGAAWIKIGLEVLEHSVFVLDKYHMMTYVNKSTAHLLDSAYDDIKGQIWEALNKSDKKGLKQIYGKILEVTDSESKKEDVVGALNYFLNNWAGINIRVLDAGARWKCCAEGQVSHVLSDRLSSRPMGWSILGCNQMAKFRAYKWNGGKIIDLLKYQKERKLKEKRIKEQEEFIKELRKRKNSWDYAEKLNVDIPGLEQRSMKWLKDLIRQAI